MDNCYEHQQDRADCAPFSASNPQTHRQEFESAIATQRMRNAAALVRTQQKVARDRLRPVRQPQ